MRYDFDQPAVLPRPAVPMASRQGVRWWLTTAAGAVGILFLGICASFGYGFYLIKSEPAHMCDMNLRHVYVAYRKLIAADREHARVSAALRHKLTRRYLITEGDAAYLYGKTISHYGGERLETLLCPRDPEFSWKVPLALSGETSLQPSYVLTPRQGIIARCPYHLRQVGIDGRVGAYSLR